MSRYLKSVFPTVEEYLLLDVLSNSDNNVQKAADRLVKMGYVKRDTPSKKTSIFLPCSVPAILLRCPSSARPSQGGGEAG